MNLALPERDCARTPMQWSNEPHGGFTKSDRPVVPVISGGPFGFENLNAARQRRDPGSLFSWTERIIRTRKEVPEIGWGDFTVLKTGDKAVLAMRYDWRGNSTLFVHNLAHVPKEVMLDTKLGEEQGTCLVNLLSDDHSRADAEGRHRLVLEGYAYRWFRIGGLDYLLKRT